MARVNPDLPNPQTPYSPTHRVTALFHGHDAVTSALHQLVQAGFAGADIDVFAGPVGEQAMKPSGEALGLAGRWFRTVEQVVSDTSAFQALAAATLRAGGFLVAALVGSDDARRAAAMDILTRNGASDVKYWSPYFVEQGHEDVPQSPAGPE
jgi:hypothetical protein